MKEIQLHRLDPKIEASLHGDPSYIEAMVDENWARVAELVLGRVGPTLKDVAPLTDEERAWGGYIVVDAKTDEVVGSCAFKGEPTDAGSVEIAYFTYPGFEGKGYATAMAQRLIHLAASSKRVRRVIAHTLPKPSGSTRVLEKNAMQFCGEVIDPDDGPVWQWQADLGA